MRTVAEQTENRKRDPWYVEQLIAGLDATAQVKRLLFLIRLHQNRKTGRAWASQDDAVKKKWAQESWRTVLGPEEPDPISDERIEG
jgi:hypothetical protein